MSTPWKRGSLSHSFMFSRYCGLLISLLQLSSATTEGEIPGSMPRKELGPYCDPKTNTIYFVDQDPSKIRSFKTDTNTEYGAPIVNAINNKPYTMTFAIPIETNASLFVAGLGGSLGVIEWDGTSDKTISPIFTKEMTDLLIRTGTTDTEGNLFIVTPSEKAEVGSLLPVDSNGIIKGALKYPGLGGHIAFGSKKFYYTDVNARVIIGMDYSSDDIHFSNSHIVFNMSALSLSGTPGGLAVDASGNLWVSCNSDPVVGFDPVGGTAFSKLPATTNNNVSVTTVVFCGSNMQNLYALANYDQSESSPSVFTVKDIRGTLLGVAGAPAKYPTKAPA